jgi:N-formylglutamate amidohydrolase
MGSPSLVTFHADPPIWRGEEGESPIVAVAVHAGHALRSSIAALTALDDAARRREEDPHTDVWTALSPTRLVACRSRFEVDLNRPRDKAVYAAPDDAWGLDLWRRPLPAEEEARSRDAYDSFYATLEGVLERAQRSFGRFVVYDIHSYNHRRDGADSAPADPAANPDINLGTGSMDRDRWAPVLDRFVATLRGVQIDGRPLDVRENVRFRGGHLAAWVHERFASAGCALAIEVKKYYMDEHTGEVDPAVVGEVGAALAATTGPVSEAIIA